MPRNTDHYQLRLLADHLDRWQIIDDQAPVDVEDINRLRRVANIVEYLPGFLAIAFVVGFAAGQLLGAIWS